jgi:DNA N-6-adenine-methyltransferase (Dam)
MAEHEPSIGQSDDWYTPPEIFHALRLTFDLDPCSPGPAHWVPARKVFTRRDDGLAQPWSGLVFMNPPFGGRNGHVPWLRISWSRQRHRNRACLYIVGLVSPLLFPKGKTKFIRPDGSIGRAPGHGGVLLGIGEVANDALRKSGLGFVVDVRGARRAEIPRAATDNKRAGSSQDWQPIPRPA